MASSCSIRTPAKRVLDALNCDRTGNACDGETGSGRDRPALRRRQPESSLGTGNKIDAKYGPSGILKNEISAGATANVFASANMEHPQALHDEKKSGPVVRFARNQLCALVKPGLAVDSVTLLDRMLDPGIKLGTSTPEADPSGECFRSLSQSRGDQTWGAIRTGKESSATHRRLQ
jgi:hypothetical protein